MFRMNRPMKRAVSRLAGLWGLKRQLNMRATGRGLGTCTERTTERTMGTARPLHHYPSFLTQPHLRYPLTFPQTPLPLCWQRMEALMRISPSPWREKWSFLMVRIYWTYKNKAVHIYSTVWYTVSVCLCVPLSVFGDRELVHLSPPKSSASQLCDSAPCQVPLPAEPTRDSGTSRPIRHTHLLRTTQSDGTADRGSDSLHDSRHHDDHSQHLSINERLEKLQTFYSSEKNGISPRMLLEVDTHTTQSSDRDHLGIVETTQTSPSAHLPRLRNMGLKEGRGRKMTWVGLTRPGPPGLLVNGSKPPAFPMQRQHTLVIKSLRQERGKRRELSVAGGAERGTTGGVMNGAKRNSVQLRSSLQRRVADLNLPLLPAALQGKGDKKNQLQSMDYWHTGGRAQEAEFNSDVLDCKEMSKDRSER